MIAYLSGKIILNKPGYVILDTGGVGYKVNVNNLDIGEKNNAELFIYEHIREDLNELYGFKSFDHLELFTKLISVNGVGPKVAMTILTVGEAGKISEAIVGGNISFFQAIPGIGKKVAAKIILELKSKIATLDSSSVINQMNENEEVFEALTTLGYKNSEISKMLSKSPSNLTPEEKIKWCLKNITK